MKIAIIGAGVIGVTTAYELAADGHEVHVFERRNSAGEEASFANAGVISSSYLSPWAAPRMPLKIIPALFHKYPPIRIQFPLKYSELGSIKQWLKACTPAMYASEQAHLHRLISYSAERLQYLSQKHQLAYDKAQGYMVLLRDEQESHQVQTNLQLLAESGFAYTLLNAEAARKIEPALNTTTALHAAVYLPRDMVANCRQFTLLLREKAQLCGAQFHFGVTKNRIEKKSHGIQLDNEPFDHVVVCAGVNSATLLEPLSIHIPLIPVYGYSISAPVREPMDAPLSGIMDQRYKVAISRIGNRVRVSGSAEIGGHCARMNQNAIRTLYKILTDWFPLAADTKGRSNNSGRGQVQVWKGVNHVLPSGGPPRVGASGVANVWLNLGHGPHGWALSCGSARILADQMAGRKSAVDL